MLYIFEPVVHFRSACLRAGQSAWRLVPEGRHRFIKRFGIFACQHLMNDAFHFVRRDIERLFLRSAGGIIGLPPASASYCAGGIPSPNSDERWSVIQRMNLRRSEEHTSELKSLMRTSYA